VTGNPYDRPSDPAKRHSAALTDGPDRAPARAMLKAIGFDDDDLARPIIGVATTWIETMPCNFNQRELAQRVKAGIRAAGGTPMEFNTVSVSDGVSMGSERSSPTRSSSSPAATCSTGWSASSAATRRSRPG
jgi:dihydroxyacid dehydratase/phosphogluconate dehydratase